MSAPQSRWTSWVAFTSEKEPALVLAIFRVLLSLCAIGSLLTAMDVLSVLWIDAAHGGAFTLEPTRLVRLFGGPTPPVIQTFWWVALVAAALSAVGLGGRWPLLVAGQAYTALVRTNAGITGGYDAMIGIAFWILFFSGANATLSVDAWRRTKRLLTDDLIPAWPRRVLVLQLVVIYFITGLQKMSPVWTPLGGYSALYWVYQDPTWRRFDMSFTTKLYPLLQVGTAITWHWELSFPVVMAWLWARRTKARGGRLRRALLRWDLRKLYLAIGVCLHLGILLTLNVGPFSFVSLSFYPLFFRPEEVRTFLVRLGAVRTPAPETGPGDGPK